MSFLPFWPFALICHFPWMNISPTPLAELRTVNGPPLSSGSVSSGVGLPRLSRGGSMS